MNNGILIFLQSLKSDNHLFKGHINLTRRAQLIRIQLHLYIGALEMRGFLEAMPEPLPAPMPRMWKLKGREQTHVVIT
jgi:hypothetical protein